MDNVELFTLKTDPFAGSVLHEVLKKSETFVEEKLKLESSLERTLFFIGSRTSGKTSLVIDVFELPDEDNKPTYAMDFFCAFQTQDGFERKMCNIWELGGGTNYAAVLMTVHPPRNFSAVIMLDLSSPNTLWHTATSALEIFRNYIESRSKENFTRQELPDSHKDKHLVKAFPVPLFFVGGKYDLFQAFEPEKKRIICQCLRYLAHINYACLLFYSNKINHLSKIAKDVFNHHVFETPLLYREQFDHNHPLMIPPGSDSMDAIQGSSNLKETPSMEKFKNLLNSYFKQDEQVEKKFPENPRYDTNFKEPSIDFLREAKDEEMEKVLREVEVKLKNEREKLNLK